MSKKLQDLRQQRGEHVAAMRAITDKAALEKRELTADEQVAYDAAETKYDAATVEVTAQVAKDEAATTRERKLEAAERELTTRAPGQAATLELVPKVNGDVLEVGGLKIGGLSRMNPQARETLITRASAEYGQAFDNWLGGASVPAQYRASLQADSDPAGGALVAPIQFISDVLKKLNDLVFIRSLATVRTVVGAQSLGQPTLDADPADADWTSELATGSEDTTMAVGRREWHPHPLAKLIKISNKLLRLTAGGAQDLVMERLAYKFAIPQEKAFLLGTGASQPLGVFTASALGISTAQDFTCAGATALTADDLIGAKYNIKGPYQDKACWLFHRLAVRNVRKLKDTNGQYLWAPAGMDGQASLTAGRPDTILGRPFYMSEYVPSTFTTGLYVGIFGAFEYYYIADALDFTVQRLIELYAATNQVGYIGRMETDGMPVFEEAFTRLKLA